VPNAKITPLHYNSFMAIPSIQEIKILDYEVQTLVEQFKKFEVGQRPCFIELDLEQRKYIEPALDNIMAALEVLSIDPRFPYPLYIITPFVLKFLDIPILANKNLLPSHFFCRGQRLNSKEQSLLKKTKMLSSKIKNNEISDATVHMQVESNSRKLLSEVCTENEFLENIIEGLQKAPEKSV
tara:strand:- start:26406 stop:26951 length:546 start_codon:yes stop_codon:yes gene_type:complete